MNTEKQSSTLIGFQKSIVTFANKEITFSLQKQSSFYASPHDRYLSVLMGFCVLISDFLWWFDDLAWWKKGIFIFKTIGLIILIAAWVFYVPTVQSLGENQFEIRHINKLMSRHDYYLMAEEHCQSFGLEITNYEAKNPYDRVNTRRHSATSTFFSCR